MKHEWWKWNGLDCCKKCGVLMRADGKNSPCKGVIQVRLRNDGAGKYAASKKEGSSNG